MHHRHRLRRGLRPRHTALLATATWILLAAPRATTARADTGADAARVTLDPVLVEGLRLPDDRTMSNPQARAQIDQTPGGSRS